MIWIACALAALALFATAQDCSVAELEQCSMCLKERAERYNCSTLGLQRLAPGKYEGSTANYLSFVTATSSPNFLVRAEEFTSCTGGKIVFSEAANVWEDPVFDLGTKTSRGSEVYDGYLMSYSHFPEVSALDLAEHLNERILRDNDRLKLEDMLPQVRKMGEYRKDGVTNIDFLMYDGDFFVPIIRLDLFEKHQIPLPNTWDEVVEAARYFNGTDLNDDGQADDFGICHFPSLVAGNWDWWFAESVYSTWATLDQTSGMDQGFFFDKDTMEPRIGPGFRYAAEIWKILWENGSNCENTNFVEGKCAIGFGPPGCWKQVFLSGVSRKDANGTIIWQPRMKNGEYAEPYRFKTFGSTRVVNRATDAIVDCTPELCPKAEKIPSKGHHGDGDRANVLPASPQAGKLINRVPFYWSGGLGTLIRKSAEEKKKDLMWDFFVYTNSPETSVHDVASYKSWLDSWRYSHLSDGSNFLSAGWSSDAYKEHAAVMQWALGNNANGAFNLRLPGVAKYTRDVVGEGMRKFINGDETLDVVVDNIRAGWDEITRQQGKLGQLEIYRATLGLDAHSEFELCHLHRKLMDQRDSSVCRKYDPSSILALVAVIITCAILLCVALAAVVYLDRKRRRSDTSWKIKPKQIHFPDDPRILGQGRYGPVLFAEFRGTEVAVKRMIPAKFNGLDQNYSNRSLDIESGSASLNEAPPSSDVGAVCRRSKMRCIKRLGLVDKLKDDFVEEMRYLSKLRHPCIATVMGAVTSKNSEPLLVMEYMDHGSLCDILHNETIALDGEIILPILSDIASGLRFLHAFEPQIVHGDLKSTNVLVDSRFRAKVSDFGKKAGSGIRTSLWAAPEILRKESESTPASDAYSFGVILYEVYSRKDPYQGEEPSEVLRLVADPGVQKRPPVPPGCPAKIRSFMAECFDALPAQRPTFEELDLQLKRLDVSKIEPTDKPKSSIDRTNELLLEVFPKHMAEALRDGRQCEPLSRDSVTIFFSDIVGFTAISSGLPPIKVSDMLGRLYTKFDRISKRHDVFKVETIGDAYMASSNLIKDQPDHAKRIAEFALETIEAATSTLVDLDDPSKGYVNIRCGIHSGPVVANVVGTVHPRFCLFGDTVNTASRCESASERNRIHASENTAMLIMNDPGLSGTGLHLSCRGKVNMKGKGELTTYWVGAAGESCGSPLRSVISCQDDISISPFKNCSGLLVPESSPKRDWFESRQRNMSLRTYNLPSISLVQGSDGPRSPPRMPQSPLKKSINKLALLSKSPRNLSAAALVKKQVTPPELDATSQSKEKPVTPVIQSPLRRSVKKLSALARSPVNIPCRVPEKSLDEYPREICESPTMTQSPVENVAYTCCVTPTKSPRRLKGMLPSLMESCESPLSSSY